MFALVGFMDNMQILCRGGEVGEVFLHFNFALRFTLYENLAVILKNICAENKLTKICSFKFPTQS